MTPAQAQLHDALAKLRAGRTRAGREILERLLGAAQPGLAPGDLALAWQRYADALFAEGEPEAARRAQRTAVRQDPFFAQVRGALQAASSGQARAAEAAWRNILQRNPNHVHALVGLANVALDRNAPEDARRLLRRALAVSPNMSHVHRAVARLAMSESRYAEAEAAARRATEIDPELAECWTSLGTVYAWGLRQADAAQAFAKALAIDPRQPRVLLSLGHVHKALGNAAESVRAYRDSIAAEPTLGEAWWSLADLKTYGFSDAEVARMEATLNDEKLFGRDRAALHFALGKAWEDRSAPAAAFKHYEQGNALRRSRESFDIERFERQCARLRAFFTAERLAAKRAPADVGPTPVFVVGLPRSGSTLVDQILSSHSQVRGTMELPHVLGYVREMERRAGYPAAVDAMTPDDLAALGARYLRETASHRGDAPFFVDKMPNNFLHVGLIACMLPQAVFVDTRRHPLACCFSIFKQNFARGQTFGYALDTLAAYYRNYVALMAHWRQALPGRVHRVVYERLVDDTEGETRRLLDHVGVPFEAACLRFFENRRVVRTASAEQVRQPIYRDAVAHWRAYRAHLAPLAEGLGEVLSTWDDEAAS